MKIIHCADLHLDSSLKTHFLITKASERNKELLNSFYRLTQYAIENKVELVLIAGDLFDQENITMRTIQALFTYISNTREVHYLYLPGNHDLKCRMLLQNKPENLFIFDDKWQSCTFGDVVISARTYSRNFYEYLPIFEGKYHIIMLHGQIQNNREDYYIDLNKMKGKHIQYLALGHIHQRSIGRIDEEGIYAYPGCLEGRGFDECGEKGFLLLDTSQKSLNFIPFAKRKLYKINVDISSLNQNHEIILKIKDALKDISKENLIEIILTGTRNLQFLISVDAISQFLQEEYYFITVKDESKLYVDIETYKKDISLKGEFIRLIYNSDLSEKNQQAIIQTGIEALLNEEISI